MEYAILALILFAMSEKRQSSVTTADARPMYGPEQKTMEQQWSEYSNPNQSRAKQYVAEGEWGADKGME